MGLYIGPLLIIIVNLSIYKDDDFRNLQIIEYLSGDLWGKRAQRAQSLPYYLVFTIKGVM